MKQQLQHREGDPVYWSGQAYFFVRYGEDTEVCAVRNQFMGEQRAVSSLVFVPDGACYETVRGQRRRASATVEELTEWLSAATGEQPKDDED